MSTFEFSEDWWLPYPRAEVAGVLLDLAMYPTWWPQVVAVASLGPALVRPVVRWNHQRMMAGCRSGLTRRLAEPAGV